MLSALATSEVAGEGTLRGKPGARRSCVGVNSGGHYGTVTSMSPLAIALWSVALQGVVTVGGVLLAYWLGRRQANSEADRREAKTREALREEREYVARLEANKAAREWQRERLKLEFELSSVLSSLIGFALAGRSGSKEDVQSFACRLKVLSILANDPNLRKQLVELAEPLINGGGTVPSSWNADALPVHKLLAVSIEGSVRAVDQLQSLA